MLPFYAEGRDIMPSQKRLLVAGLGNPGTEYESTRHNIGFMVADALASANTIALLKKKFDACFGAGSIGGVPIILAKPVSYMNRSGTPVKRLADYFDIPIEDILIVHDDIDLDFGRLKIKKGGGHGGHNGLRSIIQTFGNREFSRLRIGVGRPVRTSGDVSGFVLGRFTNTENDILVELITLCCDAIETIVCKGITAGMNKYN